MEGWRLLEFDFGRYIFLSILGFVGYFLGLFSVVVGCGPSNGGYHGGLKSSVGMFVFWLLTFLIYAIPIVVRRNIVNKEDGIILLSFWGAVVIGGTVGLIKKIRENKQ